MGATNTTANYNLSQFISTDKPAWLQDYNGDMLKIDTGINAAKLAADTAQSTATNAQTDATSAVNSVTTLASTVSSLSTAIGNINGTLNTITSLIGNGTPTTTDHTIIGAINELHADQGDLSDLQTTDKSSLVAAINEAAQGGGGTPSATNVSYDNTSSGLTATNVQDAIDELASSGGGSVTVSNYTTMPASYTATSNGLIQVASSSSLGMVTPEGDATIATTGSGEVTSIPMVKGITYKNISGTIGYWLYS